MPSIAIRVSRRRLGRGAAGERTALGGVTGEEERLGEREGRGGARLGSVRRS